MNERREFIANSAKLGALALVGVSGLSSFTFGAEAKGAKMEIMTLNNGVKMPILGLGTSRMKGKECQKAVTDALSVGYRAFDTAQMYGNEKEVGNAIKKSGLKREDIFITTKLSSGTSYEATKKSIESSLKNLSVDYIDLLLIHNPYAEAKDMYKAMEEFYAQSKLKAIGISNFNSKVYLDFIKSCKVIPAMNQVQAHVFYQRGDLQKTMAKHGTIMQAWSPFANGKNDFFKNPTLLEVGKNYGKTSAQVGLRYLVQKGINVIPKTSKIERMKENLNIFDFSLSKSDLAKIAKLDTGKSLFEWDN